MWVRDLLVLLLLWLRHCRSILSAVRHTTKPGTFRSSHRVQVQISHSSDTTASRIIQWYEETRHSMPSVFTKAVHLKAGARRKVSDFVKRETDEGRVWPRSITVAFAQDLLMEAVQHHGVEAMELALLRHLIIAMGPPGGPVC